jgi:hypothetical protein
MSNSKVMTIEDLSVLVFDSEEGRKQFTAYLMEDLLSRNQDTLQKTISSLLIEFCHKEFGLNKVYKIVQSLNLDFFEELILHKTPPTFKELAHIIHTNSNYSSSKTFTIIDICYILNQYGLDLEIGVSDRHIAYIRKLKADKQNNLLIKRDFNGLLGASKLYSKDGKSVKDKKIVRSVWTVKK